MWSCGDQHRKFFLFICPSDVDILYNDRKLLSIRSNDNLNLNVFWKRCVSGKISFSSLFRRNNRTHTLSLLNLGLGGVLSSLNRLIWGRRGAPLT